MLLPQKEAWAGEQAIKSRKEFAAAAWRALPSSTNQLKEARPSALASSESKKWTGNAVSYDDTA